MSAGFRILEIQLDDDGNYRQVCSVFSIFFWCQKIFFFGTKNVVFFQRSRRSRSVPPALIVPAPRRRYPSEVEDPPCNPPSFLSSS